MTNCTYTHSSASTTSHSDSHDQHLVDLDKAQTTSEVLEIRGKIITSHRNFLEKDFVQRGHDLTYAPTEDSTDPSRWSGYEISDLKRELFNSEFCATVRMTIDSDEINAPGFFSYTFRYPTGKYAPSSVSFTVFGKVDDRISLGHSIVHFERGTECSSRTPESWNDECHAVHSEVLSRFGL